MTSIFISYRRADSPYVDRLYDELTRRFDKDEIFLDISTIRRGDFVATIEKAVGACNVLLAVIGPQWLDIRNDKNNTVDEICKTLNISRATLYRYIKPGENKHNGDLVRP